MGWDWSPRYLERRKAPKIAYQLFEPNRPAKVAVLLIHGYGEHSLRYRHAVETWASQGILVGAWDLRGHGHSGGHRGHVQHFDEYVDDATALLRRLEQSANWRGLAPPILFGHSLGGLIAVHLALRSAEQFGGLVLSSPFLEPALEIPAPKRAAGRVMSLLWPTFSLPTGIRGGNLTHDETLAREFDEDPLTVHRATARWYTEVLAAQAIAMSSADRITIPVYAAQGDEDPIAQPRATDAFVRSLKTSLRQFEVAPGQRHELLNEVERERWIGKFADVLLGWRPVQRNAAPEF